jgi:hypothetical protein
MGGIRSCALAGDAFMIMMMPSAMHVAAFLNMA